MKSTPSPELSIAESSVPEPGVVELDVAEVTTVELVDVELLAVELVPAEPCLAELFDLPPLLDASWAWAWEWPSQNVPIRKAIAIRLILPFLQLLSRGLPRSSQCAARNDCTANCGYFTSIGQEMQEKLPNLPGFLLALLGFSWVFSRPGDYQRQTLYRRVGIRMRCWFFGKKKLVISGSECRYNE